MKSGIKTTEFWIALIGSALMIGVTAGFWTSAEVQAFVDSLTSVAQAVAVLIATAAPITAAAVMAWKYITGRVDLKKLGK